MELVLASGSPRRQELLSQLGYRFDILVPDIEEQQQSNESPESYVRRLAYQKALAAADISIQRHAEKSLACEHQVFLGSDTVVVLDGIVFEKPQDLDHSRAMLTRLSNQKHQVMTAISAVAVKQGVIATSRTELVVTSVWFTELTDQNIEHYWQTGEPKDKAGSYAIQGIGGKFVKKIEGSYHAVVGLPLFETEQLLQNFKDI
jgi:septum formation protein